MQVAGKSNRRISQSFADKVIPNIAYRYAPIFGQFHIPLRVNRVGSHAEDGFIATRFPGKIQVVRNAEVFKQAQKILLLLISFFRLIVAHIGDQFFFFALKHFADFLYRQIGHKGKTRRFHPRDNSALLPNRAVVTQTLGVFQIGVQTHKKAHGGHTFEKTCRSTHAELTPF